jgi:hypothetical protein
MGYGSLSLHLFELTCIQIAFSFRDEDNILQVADADQVVLGQISRLLTVECQNETKPWIEIKLSKKQPSKAGFLRFKESAILYYIPLGWNGWTIAKRAFICGDPTTRGETIYNHRVKWQLADQWASSRSGTPPPSQPHIV